MTPHKPKAFPDGDAFLHAGMRPAQHRAEWFAGKRQGAGAGAASDKAVLGWRAKRQVRRAAGQDERI